MDRIRKELVDIGKDTASGVTATPVADSVRHLQGTIKGPIDSPYEHGVFVVDIVLPDSYPFEPPKMRFLTRVWHPNISSQTGAICLDILKDAWSPALTIKVGAPCQCSCSPGVRGRARGAPTTPPPSGTRVDLHGAEHCGRLCRGVGAAALLSPPLCEVLQHCGTAESVFPCRCDRAAVVAHP
jgi:hypothetical protein